jgi:hypothetical protein
MRAQHRPMRRTPVQSPVQLASVRPMAPPENGNETKRTLNEILDSIFEESKRFLYMDERDRVLLTVWAAYTHAWDLFDHAPILGLHSPVPGCGKTDTLRILACIVQKGRHELSPTPATLFREIEQDHPTLLLDEMDKAYWPSLQPIINGGFTRGIWVPRCEGDDNKVTHFSPFGPKALASMGKELPADTGDRTNMIRLKKKPPGHKLESLKMAFHEERLRALGQEVAGWVSENKQAILASEPDLPDLVIDRGGDRWRSLFALAALAGPKWLKRVSDAAQAHEARKGTGDIKLTLLQHILDLEAEWPPSELMTPTTLAEALNGREDWPYGAWDKPLTANTMGQMLKQLGVTAKPTKKEGKTHRLYDWAGLKRGAAENGLQL